MNDTTATLPTSAPPSAPTSVPTYQPLPDEDHDTCYESLGWSVWALQRAMEFLTFPVDALAREMSAETDYAAEAVEAYKMLAIERVLAARRERIADDMLGRLREALALAHHLPEGDPLTLRIDYSKVPPCPGLHPGDINFLCTTIG